MKLYIYDHCPYCVKARMIFGLKDVDIEIITLLNDEETLPMQMIGQKMVPILQKEDGSYMPESMDIIHYIDENYGDGKVVASGENGAITEWLEQSSESKKNLAIPRWIEAPLEEFATEGAKHYFTYKKEAMIGSFAEHRARSAEYIEAAEAELHELDSIIASTEAAHASGLSEDDFHLFAALRSLSIVKDLKFPGKVMQYMQTMSAKSQVPLHLDIAVY